MEVLNYIYTGIGSRKTPPEVLSWMIIFAGRMRNNGLTLRSGGAAGADTAFEIGARREKQVYIHQNGYKGKWNNNFNVALDCLPEEKQSYCYTKAERIHPAWGNCDDWSRAMHARNILQIEGLGGTLSDFVVYWAEYDRNFNPKGGTATAVNYAKTLGIPTFNINIPMDVSALEEFVNAKYHC